MVGRLFVAVPLTDEARHGLVARLSDTGVEVPGKAVPPENWHLTIRFLGQTDEVTYDKVVASLAEAELGEAFGISFTVLGAFPKPRRAAVLWVAVGDGAEPLKELAGEVEVALETAGFPPEDRPFRGHLTLARVRPRESVEVIVDGTPSLDVRMPVDRVVVYRSHLGRPSATYEELESFPLRT